MSRIFAILLVACLAGTPAAAKDIRQAHIDLEKQRQAMAVQAEDELARAKAAARENAQAIRRDRQALEAAISRLSAGNKKLKKENQGLEKNILALGTEGDKLRAALEESRAVNKELAGFVRAYAKDLDSLLDQSLQSALTPDREKFLGPLINQERFWSMDDLRRMADTALEEIEASGRVEFRQGPIIDRQGRDRTAKILTLGNFTGIYVLESETGASPETGFLIYSDQSRRFFALSKLPSVQLKDQLDAYLAGDADAVPMDMSRGGALRRFTHELNLAEQVPKGGPIVWPILAILGLALLILLERWVFFLRRRLKVEPFMAEVRRLIDAENWADCETLMAGRKRALIPKVLLKVLPFRDRSRSDMENALQEAILGEIPAIERFLSTLGMLAAIAPLMGLLGTVTGMINTFHVITYYGTGDPRMMSGGISEALVTTMLGLAVAIPIMLCHTLLSRMVETHISRMEEKAVSFVNMVFKARNECRPPEGAAQEG
ncbi:MAG: DUF3450 family protein [Desulfobacter sp.]|nr:MAG: DUF3450 family protein [Desulfobacter sp.]